MPPPLPPAKLLIPEDVEQAKPAAQIICSDVRPETTPHAIAAATGPTTLVL
jgi:hypothetical protein